MVVSGFTALRITSLHVRPAALPENKKMGEKRAKGKTFKIQKQLISEVWEGITVNFRESGRKGGGQT